VLYDKATGASPAGDVPANSNSAAGSDGSNTGPSQAPCVTLDNLQTGYLNLGQHDKVVTAKARAWPEWYARTFRGTAQ
jgi:hypothetical protein